MLQCSFLSCDNVPNLSFKSLQVVYFSSPAIYYSSKCSAYTCDWDLNNILNNFDNARSLIKNYPIKDIYEAIGQID